MTTNELSRSLGCIYGLAIGDALGAAVEFTAHRDILAKHGADGIRDFVPWGGFRAGSWTDDTQLSIATAEGLVRARGAGRLDDPILFIHRQYLVWLDSQELPENVRAPGRTCLTALRSGVCGTIERPLNRSKGCGALMRSAPIGLVLEPEQAFTAGVAAGAATHGHPSGYLPSGFVASLISDIDSGIDLIEAIERAIIRLQQRAGHEETLGRIWQAIDLVGTNIPAHSCIHAIGGGWTGDEALAIAAYCSLKFSDYRSAVLAATNHSGDSDSTASITGAIMGTFLGVDAIPQIWVERVEGSAMLGRVAEELVGEPAQRNGDGVLIEATA